MTRARVVVGGDGIGVRRAVAVVGIAATGLAVLAGCSSTRVLSTAPSGQTVLPWAEPFDREALLAAMPYYRAADLSGYTFSLLLVVQNYLEQGFAVTLEVNGQDIERRYIGALTQEIFAVTPGEVNSTEAALGLDSAATDARLEGQSCPFVVRLKRYVTEDGYIIQNSNFVLAPENVFESKTFNDVLDTSFKVSAHHVCPGAFAIVIKAGAVDFIELDREFIPVNEPDDNSDVDFTRDYDPDNSQYHPETIQALNALGLSWLLPPPDEQTGTGN